MSSTIKQKGKKMLNKTPRTPGQAAVKISDTKLTWLKCEVEKLTSSGISKAEISRRLNIFPQAFNNILNGNRGVTDAFLDKFIQTFDLNSSELYSQLLPESNQDALPPTKQNSTLLERIAQLASKANITISGLEKQIGASKGVLPRAVQNNTDIQSKWLCKIVEAYPEFSAEWLLTGKGEMLRKKSSPPGESIIEMLFNKTIEQAKQIGSLEEQIAGLKQKLEKTTNNNTNA